MCNYFGVHPLYYKRKKKLKMSNSKRLERDIRNKAIGGVCSGLANYFDMDPAFWRVLFFFVFFFGGSGLLIYLILWIVMPAKKDYETTDAIAHQAGATEVGNERKKKNNNMAAGLILIGIGVICLVGRYIPEINWRTAWPIFLIILGLVLIIPINRKNHEK